MAWNFIKESVGFQENCFVENTWHPPPTTVLVKREISGKFLYFVYM